MLPEIVKRDTRYSSYWERPYTQWKVSSWDSFYREKYPTASNLIKILTIISYFFFKVIIAQVPIHTFPIETVNYYVSGGNGIQIYVEEKGNPEKTTILFTSGYMSSRQSWHPLCDKPRDVKSYSLELSGQDLQAVITKIKIDKPNKKIITVGWSMGTPTTMTFMKINPDIKIDGFISVGGMIYLNFTKSKFKNLTFKPASDQFRAFKLGESIIVPPEILNIENLKLNVKFDFRDFFSSLDIPTLNLIGEKDKLITLEHSLQFANLAKNGKKIVYPPSWEDTKSVVRDITEFVSNI
ncbi:alpha/beta-hydrolase [Rhizophagus irregularis]|uniref:Alpha/beta-hydrolase n=1 Tax=Rhizophagus irregularis TaxID=588596 RepID=A0A2I1E3B8_9GLOM|nr:alpha/beta-hydrolase [Rhizophagus irregularis]PKY16601.1 alpha/beta-hydrolase [Rhizophagus irregularis]